MERKHTLLHGKTIHDGTAIGAAEIRLEDPSVVPSFVLESETDVEAEIVRFREALEAADQDAEADLDWARGILSQNESEIFAAQRMILRDPTLLTSVETAIRETRTNAARAVRHRFDQIRVKLELSSSEIIRNRVIDMTDAERLILSHLGGRSPRDQTDTEPVRDSRVILVTDNPPPSLLARMDPDRIAGILCEQGGQMGHVAVLARALDLPALIQVEGLLAQVRDGDLLIIEADEAQVLINPAEEALESARENLRRRRLLAPPAPSDPRGHRRTADGRRIYLLGNAGARRDIHNAAQVDADGIGLYRTEFFYLSRTTIPTEAELVEEYSDAACAFTQDPVDIRLLDLGSDKHLPGTRLLHERNPALGLRSLRFLQENPALLRTQIRAVLQAAADGPVRLLLPMVSGVDDIRRIRSLVHDLHEDLRREGIRHSPDLPVGAMIEHPAGVALAPEIFAESDFISIGSNDLAQYILAVDRDAAHLAAYYDPCHPAVLRALAHLSALSLETGTPLSVCGEIAGDPSLTALLVGLGVERLSMAPQWILPVGLVLASVDAAEWRTVADRAVSLATTREIRTLIREAESG